MVWAVQALNDQAAADCTHWYGTRLPVCWASRGLCNWSGLTTTMVSAEEPSQKGIQCSQSNLFAPRTPLNKFLHALSFQVARKWDVVVLNRLLCGKRFCEL